MFGRGLAAFSRSLEVAQLAQTIEAGKRDEDKETVHSKTRKT